MMMRRNVVLALAALLVCAFAVSGAGAGGTVTLDQRSPRQGEAVRVRVLSDGGNPIHGADVSVTYRPGSNVERTNAIGRSDLGGMLEWRPKVAGIATVTATWAASGQAAGTASTTVSVRFHSPPVNGIIIMIVAGVLLIGGSVVRVFKLLGSPEPD